MEKILKRSAQAAKTADKRISKRLKAVKKSQHFMLQQNHQSHRKAASNLILAERKRRQEHWERGALAARHDVGVGAASWGTIPQQLAQVPDQFEKLKPDWFHIQAADRVVVLSGRARGTIAEVKAVDEERCTVQLSGINVDYKVPSFMREAYNTDAIVARPMDIPLQNVRLVYAIPDRETGMPKDVIIERMEPVGREWDKHKKEFTRGQRLIYGTDTIIPWPEEIRDEWDLYADDTTVDLVDVVTYQPTLLKAPMPLSIIDELRGKYSRFRSRFDWETKEKIMAKADREEQRKDLIKTMRTPLQELAEMRAKQKEARQQDLTTEQLARIGAIMEQGRAAGTAATLR
ncbi:hypothetical protein AMS68_002929 [Peltaster fructicola]|uniref:KOW domain-containing protein n=1 Tax=Peltaster fructicola TaxID=286661 RepID=A0A6H0XRM2_9PEZI|nr:hypothetical protein AMS68_002929 [Peltaster fructicola]